MKILRTWTFKWWEIPLLKICLLSLGIIFALYFHNYLVDLMWLWWGLFGVTMIYFIYKFFADNKR